jgi:ADP-ribose pyrophosphatase YjhB (NUDIX family)
MGEEIQEKHRNPITAVDFVIRKNNDSKVPLVKRKNEPSKDILSIPEDFTDEGETAEDAMNLGAKAETCFVV